MFLNTALHRTYVWEPVFNLLYKMLHLMWQLAMSW